MLETIQMKKESLRRGGQGGFTLIELLIVIVILAILAAIVVFAVGSTTKNAVAASCSSDAKTVETAVSAYQAQNGAITDTGATMAAWYAVLTGTGGSSSVYLRAMPASTHYTIFFTTAGAVYALPYSASYTPTTAAAAEVNTLVSGAPAATNNNFDTNPSICSSFT
jgi:general secretion pathway protein G